MTSPNEPGQSGLGERFGTGDGSTEVPPWQSAMRGRPDSAPRPVAEAVARTGLPTAVAASSSLPVSRYLTGSAAPDLSGLDPRTAPEPRTSVEPPRAEPIMRAEAPGVEAYPSELPDLSGPLPKPAVAGAVQRRSLAEPPRQAGAHSVGAPTSRIQVANRPRGPVRASMQIRRIDPWSALKVSALLSGALFFIWMIAVAFLYLVLGAMGVWSKLNSNVGDLLTSGSGAGGDLVSAGSIFGGAALVGLVNIVLLTAMATIGAYIYNLSTDIVGGVEVTLADLD